MPERNAAMNWDWLVNSPEDVAFVLISAIGTYAALIVLSRLSGLRAYSKMASFDFAITIATGSLVASIVLSRDVPLFRGLMALAFLFGLQFLVAFVRSRDVRFKSLIDNRPLLLMVGTQMLDQNLKTARVTEDEVREKLRTANVINYEQVLAVVMETTGDISVLHAPPDGPAFDYDLLQGVRDAHLVPALLEAQQRERRQARKDAENISPR